MLCSHHKQEAGEGAGRNGSGRENEPLSETKPRWLRPWCSVCRTERLADRRVESGVEQIQAETRIESDGTLARLLNALGLPTVPVLTEQDRTRLMANLRRQLPLIGLVLFATTFAMPELIVRKILETVRFGSFGADALQTAAFWLILGLGFYLKPLLAMVVQRSMPSESGQSGSDAGRLRLRIWLIGGALMAALGWFGIGLVKSPPASLVLWTAGGIGVCLALVSLVIGGLLVEQGQRMGATGRLGAMHAAVIFLARLTGAGLSEVVKADPLRVASMVSGVLLILCALWAGWALFKSPTVTIAAETRDRGDNRAVSGMISTTGALLSCRNMWGAGGIAALIYIAPNFVALQQAQNTILHFSPWHQNNLDLVGAGFGLIGVVAYLWLCRRLTLQTMLTVGIVCNAIGTLLYFGYHSLAMAYFIEGANGLLSALVFAMLFDLAIRAIPRGHAMTGYALLTGLIALCSRLSNLFGSWLALRVGWDFPHVVGLSAALSLPAIAVVALLPASLLDRREGTIVVEALPERTIGTGVPSFGTSS